jgi:hypothetical protein
MFFRASLTVPGPRVRCVPMYVAIVLFYSAAKIDAVMPAAVRLHV